MKKYLLSLLAAFIFSIAGFAQKYNFQNLIGKWESPEGAGIEVVDSSTIFLCYGKEKKQVASYNFDFSKSPNWFDFSVKDSSQNISSMKSLLLFLNDDTLQWQVFDDGNRPGSFSISKGELVYLKRKK